MEPMIKVYLADDSGEKFFGEGPYQLLKGIDKSGSLRASAAEMRMAYTKALKIIKQAEEHLGYPLINRVRGGKCGGGSQITIEGKKLIMQYEQYAEACRNANRQIYQEIFGSEREKTSPDYRK